MASVKESADSKIWQLRLTRQAKADFDRLVAARLEQKARILLKILQNNPFQNPPSYEKLIGDLAGAYSRRLNRHHRLVYQVVKEAKSVKIVRMWTHYE